MAKTKPKRSVAQRSAQAPHKRKTVVRPHPERPLQKLRVASLQVAWLEPESDFNAEEYDREADKILHLLMSVIPTAISDKIFEKWLDGNLKDKYSH